MFVFSLLSTPRSSPPPLTPIYVSLTALICPFSYRLLKRMQWRSWDIHSWNPSSCPDEIHLIKLFAVLCSGNCLRWPPTSTKLWACQIWRLKGCRGAAACADVPLNCRSRHAETIPLNHFKASAIGVTAGLNQLQNVSPVFIPHRWIDRVCGACPRRGGGEKALKEGDSQPRSWLTLICQCPPVVRTHGFDMEQKGKNAREHLESRVALLIVGVSFCVHLEHYDQWCPAVCSLKPCKSISFSNYCKIMATGKRNWKRSSWLYLVLIWMLSGNVLI